MNAKETRNPKGIKPRSELAKLGLLAARLAAKDARRMAHMHQTGLVVMKDGKVVTEDYPISK